MEDWTLHLAKLGTVAVLVLLNGFFVASEFALVSVRRSRVDELVSQGKRGALSVRSAVRDLDRYIAGTQVGITLASLGLGWIGEPALAHLIEPVVELLPFGSNPAVLHTIAVGIAFAIITFLHVVIGELVPKSLALQQPESVSLVVARPMRVVVLMLQPLIWSLNGVGNRILRLMKMQPAGEHHGVHSVEELEILVRQSHAAGILDDLEQQILNRTFKFSELSVGQIMIPRTDILGVDITDPLDVVLRAVSDAQHNRVVAYEGSLDTIVGILYVQDIFRAMLTKDTPVDIRALCRKPFLVPEGVKVDGLLELLKEQRTQIAIVIDEYGSTAGLVTYIDIIEEVTGEVHDTLKSGSASIEKSSARSGTIRGTVRLDEANSAFGWDLVDDEVDTVAGFIMRKLGRVAVVGDVIETPDGSLEVLQMDRTRITLIALTSTVELG